MTVFAYSRVPAFNPNTTPVSVARSASGSVYDIGDTGFTTPLNLTLVATNTVTTTLVSDANGMFPDFTLVDRTQCVFKSGSGIPFLLTTTTPIPGPPGAASTVPGPPGPATTDASLLTAGTVADERLPTRLSVGELSATYAPALVGGKAPVRKDEIVLNVKDYGAKGDGTTDDTAAVQSAIAAAPAGATIYFPWTGAYYKITDTLTVTTANIRFLGVPRDGYAVSIRCGVAGKVMIAAKASGFVLQDLGLMGDVTAVNGVGATVTGLELFGTVDGDLDALVKGATFQWLAKGVRTHGRNATIQDSLFSNALNGVTIDGPDAYNTGANAAQNRGNLIRGNRFHNIGANANDSAFEVTSAAKILHAVIESNHFDSNGGGRHVKVAGTATNFHSGMTFLDNKHTEAQADAYNLTYVQNSTIDGAQIHALTGTTLYGSGFVLANCDTIRIGNSFALQLGNSGIVATSCNRIHVHDTRFRSIGLNPGTTGHGLDFNSSNSQCRFDRVTVETTDGYGFNGDVADSSITECEFRSCTLGAINSTTMRNRASNGRNVYIEGTGGRKQDNASKQYDLADGVATPLATITGGSAYTSFEVEVKVIGRNSAGNLYARYVRYVRPENGSPVYVTPVADVAQGTITLAFATSGTTGVTVSATATGSTAFVTAHVTALAGGGAATGNARGVTVAML